MLLSILEACHLEIIWQLKVRLRISLERFEIYKKRVFDCKDSVVVDVLARSVEDLGNNRFVTGCSKLRYVRITGRRLLLWKLTYQKVYMSRSEWMSIQRLQDLACRAIKRYGIGHRPQTIEAILPILACCESASEIHLWLVWILLFVQSVRCRMPYVHHRALDRLTCLEVCDCAMHKCPVTLLIYLLGHDTGAHRQLRSVLPIEGA